MKLLKHENRTPDETSEDSKTCAPTETREINQFSETIESNKTSNRDSTHDRSD